MGLVLEEKEREVRASQNSMVKVVKQRDELQAEIKEMSMDFFVIR